MPTGSRKPRSGCTKQPQNSGTTPSSHATSLLKLQQNVTLNVVIVQEKNLVTIWTFDSSNQSWMRLVNTDLEVLAYTFSESRSFTQGSLTLSPTSSGRIRATLYCSPQTEQRSMNVSMTLQDPVSVKPYGPGDLKPSLQKQLKRSLKSGGSFASDSSKKEHLKGLIRSGTHGQTKNQERCTITVRP